MHRRQQEQHESNEEAVQCITLFNRSISAIISGPAQVHARPSVILVRGASWRRLGDRTNSGRPTSAPNDNLSAGEASADR